ncbi:hypothetical protein Tco_0856434 [Tanacetum coccineum]|uniref:Uncharacterized protein n=1 Tax=Tanacetum coccineum TaxID=301880 RepID=A0ABQ5B5G0_9ASTR
MDMLDESFVPRLNNLNFFDLEYLNDHSDIPNDEERSDPNPNRNNTWDLVDIPQGRKAIALGSSSRKLKDGGLELSSVQSPS